MSNRYKGAVISATPPTTTGGESGVASGSWTLEQQFQAQGAGNWPIPFVANYIEDVFSTYLYTPSSSNININIPNGIDLSTKGGMVWFKNRGLGTSSAYHCLVDTVRGGTNVLHSNLTTAAYTSSIVSSFNTNGFTTGTSTFVSNGGYNFVSWTFRKQPKFFDIVTYTGNGVNGRAISHNLGSTPGFIVVKCTSSAAQWVCWHRSYNSGNGYGYLNDTTSWYNTGSDVWGNGTTYTAPTSTTFTVNAGSGLVNDSGATYVAYIYAHNAGGFGLTGTDNVISCGSFTYNSTSGNTITLGYEPQFILAKPSSAVGGWNIADVMRGMPVDAGSTVPILFPNTSGAESSGAYPYHPTATGFNVDPSYWANGTTVIYIAIRRGPMKVPTSGTSVFLPSTFTGSNSVDKSISTNFTVDMTWGRARNAVVSMEDFDRLRGAAPRLVTDSTAAEISAQASNFDVSNGITLLAGYDLNYSTLDFVNYTFGRAPGFFDEVCYTGTGSTPQTYSHNLGVVPELIIAKCRNTGGSAGYGWLSYCSYLNGGTNPERYYIYLNRTDAAGGSDTIAWGNIAPTSTQFSVGGYTDNGASAKTYVAYLFATCPGVSKVGSYTGTGALQTINCGFAAGARFVLIKRTDSTGDWYTYDSARGISSSSDPYLLLNSAAAEVTGTNYVDTTSVGFQVTAAAPAGLNASGGTYIFLAIA